jgi:hypothetical protein
MYVCLVFVSEVNNNLTNGMVGHSLIPNNRQHGNQSININYYGPKSLNTYLWMVMMDIREVAEYLAHSCTLHTQSIILSSTYVRTYR